MESVNYSNHAKKRRVQRGISSDIVDVVLDFGRRDYDNRGACRYFLGKLEKQRVSRAYPDLSREVGRKLDTVVVVATDDTKQVITAFVRKRKTRHFRKFQ